MYSALMDLGGAAALAAPMSLVGAVLVVAALWIVRPAWEQLDFPTSAPPPGSALASIAASLGIGAALAAALAVPAAVLAFRVPSWNALWLALLDARSQAWQTLALSSAAALICTVLAAVIVQQWLARRRQGRHSLAPLVLLNLTVPPSLLGIGVIELVNHWPLDFMRDTSWPLVMAYVARFLPVAVLVLYLAWRNESQLPSHAAAVHGVAPWRSFLRIRWPARRGALAAAALLCLLLAATELEVSTLLAPPGGATLGVRLATLIHTAGDAIVSALAIDILALVAPLIILLTALAVAAVARRGNTT
jgi:iron(III) transport system permease protein